MTISFQELDMQLSRFYVLDNEKHTLHNMSVAEKLLFHNSANKYDKDNFIKAYIFFENTYNAEFIAEAIYVKDDKEIIVYISLAQIEKGNYKLQSDILTTLLKFLKYRGWKLIEDYDHEIAIIYFSFYSELYKIKITDDQISFVLCLANVEDNFHYLSDDAKSTVATIIDGSIEKVDHYTYFKECFSPDKAIKLINEVLRSKMIRNYAFLEKIK